MALDRLVDIASAFAPYLVASLDSLNEISSADWLKDAPQSLAISHRRYCKPDHNADDYYRWRLHSHRRSGTPVVEPIAPNYG